MSDIETIRYMLGQAERNLAFFRSQPDAAYADVVACMRQVAEFSARLQSLTFGQISGSSR